MSDAYTERVRIWVGTFPSRRAYGKYFFPSSSRLDAPPTQFAIDQGIEDYGFMSVYLEFRDEGPTEDLRELLDVYYQSEWFAEQACRAYSQSGIGPVNTIFMALGEEIPKPKPVSGGNYQLHVLGEFTFEVPLDAYDEDEYEEEDDFLEPVSEVDPATAKAIAGRGPMDEDRFWAMIERSWDACPDGNALRQKFLKRKRKSPDMAEALQFEYCRTFIAFLEAALKQLNKRDLLKFDRLLERRLHDLDRPDIHDRTGGSNDGFLYCRGFIVSLGKDYFDAVTADAKQALSDVEFEDICMCAVREHADRYGAPPPPSRISRESFTNKAHWK